MSSSICRHFSTFPFVKLIEQFNELKSFRRREKKIPTPLLSLLLNLVTTSLALPAPVTGLHPPWASEQKQQGLRKVRQSLLEPLYSWLLLVQAAIPAEKRVSSPAQTLAAGPDRERDTLGVFTSVGSLARWGWGVWALLSSTGPCTWPCTW